MDRISSEHRSWNMSRIKGKDTKPELLVRKYLFSRGLRYRVKSSLVGNPDLVFSKMKAVIFVHGCFWHLHGCKNSTIPKSNREFWEKKLKGNRMRDRHVKRSLKKNGWHVITVWECELRKDTDIVLKALYNELEALKGE